MGMADVATSLIEQDITSPQGELLIELSPAEKNQ